MDRKSSMFGMDVRHLKGDKFTDTDTCDAKKTKHQGIAQISDSLRFIARTSSGLRVCGLNDRAQILAWDNASKPLWSAESYSKVSEGGRRQVARLYEVAEEGP